MLQPSDGFLEHFESVGMRLFFTVVKPVGRLKVLLQLVGENHRDEGLDHVAKGSRVTGRAGFMAAGFNQLIDGAGDFLRCLAEDRCGF